ncbi:MAG TPA: ATP-binding protein [Anaerolineae bacterium]
MKLSLFWKLMLAFAVVVLISLSAVVFLANQVATSELHRFMMGDLDDQGSGMGQGGMMGRGPQLAQQVLLERVSGVVLTGGAIALLAALGVGYVVFRGITRPVEKLTRAAQAVSGGDLSARVTIESGDELADLGSTFNTMADNLQRGEQLRRDMTADIAHELRTPLAVIQSNLEALLDGIYPLDAEHLSNVLAQTKVLTRLVEDLRVLALAEAGQLPLDRRPADAGGLAVMVASAFRPRAAEKGVSIETDIAPNLPPASLDTQRMYQVLSNLIDNAIRHTPGGGQIVVGARLDGDHHIALSVSDTGSGIAAEDLPFIFERFYRADRSRARGEGGSGLGLAIAKTIVVAHGGAIHAKSEVGKGTRVDVLLPALSAGR